MGFLRAILLGILLWVLIFFEVSILMFGLNLEGASYYIAHFFALIFLVLLFSYIYFRKADSGVKQGVLLGFIFIVTGTILDSIITIPLWIIPQGGSYSSFFSIYMLVGYLEIIVLTALSSLIFRKSFPIQSRSLEELKRQVTKFPESLKNYKEAEVPVRVSKVVINTKSRRARKTRKKR